MNENEIREELTRVIAEDSQNIDEILKLSHKLAALDNDSVRFSVDVSVIDRFRNRIGCETRNCCF